MSAPLSANNRVSIEVENSCNWCCFRRKRKKAIIEPHQFTKVVHQPSTASLTTPTASDVFTTEQLKMAASTAGLDFPLIVEAGKTDVVFNEIKQEELPK